MDNEAIRLREYEREVQRKVNKALSKIEVAIAQWDMSAEKPEELAQQIEALKSFHYYFSEWERISVMGCSANPDAASTAERLEQFADLCDEFRGAI